MIGVVTAANEAVLEVDVAGPVEDRWERVGADRHEYAKM
jgi:hypothetical protein